MADQKWIIDEYRDTVDYVDKISKRGLTAFQPAILTCAITGGIQGKEANPNLPELIDEQVQQAYDAYNAGAVCVHIHRRDPKDPKSMSQSADEYLEVNARIRAKCPDIIINNTCMGGRMMIYDNATKQVTIQQHFMDACLAARPEVTSFDVTNFVMKMVQPARKAPLTGRDQDTLSEQGYVLFPTDGEDFLKACDKYEIKPEFELFDIGDIKYMYQYIAAGLVKPPYWTQCLFNGNGCFPTIDMMLNVTRLLPPKSMLSVIGIGPVQFAMVAAAMILGHHFRTGLEDNVFIGKGKLADSNAQLVEKVVRIAKELERPLATCAQAREMMGLGAPRKY